MTDKILSEIEKFFEENEDETQIQLYADAFKRLDMDSQFQIIDSIKHLITENDLETEQAIIQVFNNVLQQKSPFLNFVATKLRFFLCIAKMCGGGKKVKGAIS